MLKSTGKIISELYGKLPSAVALTVSDVAIADSLESYAATGTVREGVLDNSETYVYMAWAEAPFVNSNGVPGTAR